MKKISKLFLVSTSFLSLFAVAGCSVKNGNEEFVIEASTQETSLIGKREIRKGTKPLNAKFVNFEGTDVISPCAVQLSKSDNPRNIRLVAAVHMQDDNELLSYLSSTEGKEIGFHISYTKSDSTSVDKYVSVANAYRSITAGDNTYLSSGEEEGKKTMAEWISDCNFPSCANNYNYFIALEIKGITDADINTEITTQPYIKNGEDYSYSKNYRVVDASQSPIYYLKSKEEKTRLTYNSLNSEYDEYMIKDVYLEKGVSVSVVNSYGISCTNFENSEMGEGIIPRDGNYSFYYKPNTNSIYVGIPNGSYSFFVDSKEISVTPKDVSGNDKAAFSLNLNHNDVLNVKLDGIECYVSDKVIGTGTYSFYVNNNNEYFLVNETGYALLIDDNLTSYTSEEELGENDDVFVLSLNKDDEVNFYKNGSSYEFDLFKSTFIAPATGEYKFYVKDDEKKVYYTSTSAMKFTVNYVPNWWKNDSAIVTIKLIKDSEVVEYKTLNFYQITGDAHDAYEFYIPTGYSNYQLLRYNPEANTTWNESNVVAFTEDNIVNYSGSY